MSFDMNVFSVSEYKNRCKKAQELMEQKKIDALFITEEKNYFYFSGHSSWEWMQKTKPFQLVIPKNGDPIMIIPHQEEANARLSTWIKDIKTWYDLPYSASIIKDVLKEIGLANGVIGAEFGEEQRLWIPYNEFLKLRKDLPNTEFIDATDILWKLRMIKSDVEVEYIKRACDILGKAYEYCFNMLRAGMTEKDVVKNFAVGMMQGGSGKVGFIIDPIACRSIHFSNRKIKKGDIIALDAGATYNGYCSDYARFAIIGKPSDKQKKIWENVWKVTEKYIQFLKPGEKISAAVKKMLKETGKYGFEKKKGTLMSILPRCGHGIGLDFLEPPSLSPYNDNLFEPGMTLSPEQGFGGFHAEEDAVITDDGCKILSTYPHRELYIV